jgi:uncharacterized protein (TIGR02246 family)
MMTGQDEAEIRALYQKLIDGWNAGSGEAFGEPLTEDADFVAFDGTYFKGRQAVVDFQNVLFKKHLKGSRLTGKVSSVRFLTESVALMHAIGGTVMPGSRKASPARNSIQTLVAVKRSSSWRLAAFQNTRIKPIGKTLMGTLLWLTGDWLWRFALPVAHD